MKMIMSHLLQTVKIRINWQGGGWQWCSLLPHILGIYSSLVGNWVFPTWWYYVFAAESPVNVWCWYLAASVCLCVVSLYLCSGSILWFLLHSLLNHEKWITCIFSVKNDSMTHKTINLSDMCYFQPPILIKITVNPHFQFLMLPDKTLKIHIFHSKIV